MSYIHFKSAFDSNFDKVEFDGVSLPLAQLKRLICEKAKFVNNKQVDFDLEITNVDTNEVYQNENDQVLKNARVIFKRTLRSSMTPLRAKPAKVSNPISSAPTVAAPAQVSANSAGISTAHSQVTGVSTPVTMSSLSTATKTNLSGSGNSNPPASLNTPKPTDMGTNSLPKSVYDSLAPLNLPSKPVIYHENIPQRTAENIAEQKTQDESNLDEKAKLDLILQSSMNKTAGMDGSSATGGGQTNTTGTGFNYPRFNSKPWVRMNHNSMSMISMNNRVPPPNYVCTTCRKPGHFKQHCPEAEFMPRPEDRPKLPKGIPKSILRLAPPGATFSMQGAEGTRVMTNIEYEAALNSKKDKLIFLTEEEEEQLANEKQQQALNDRVKIPDELKCPFGDHLIKDAVLVPCCGHFVCCDECIKQKISNDENIECPYEKCDQEIGSLSSITPFHETRKKVADYLNELKLKSSSSLVAAANQNSTAANALNAPSSDPLFDMILSGINEPSKLTKTIPSEIKPELDLTPKAVDESNVKSDPSTSPKSGTESPLQDRKISSSIEQQQQQQQQLSQGTKMSENLDALSLEQDDKAKLSLSPVQQQPETKPAQFQPALLPTPSMIGLDSGATKPPINKSLSPSNVTYESSSFVNRPYNPNQQYRPYIRPVTNMPQPNVGYPRPRMPIHPMAGGQFVPGGQNFTNQNIPPPPGPFMPRATYPRYGFDPSITNPMMPVLNYQAPHMVGQGPPMNMMPPNMGGILPNQQPPPLYAGNQMTLQPPQINAPSIQSLPGVAPMSQIPQGVLSEAEFYKMKERLMKEQEGDYSKSSSYSNKTRRYDSRSRSRSRSRKRSPRETRSRTRSRSRSRGRRGRYSPRSRSKSYTRSRSRSTDKYRKQSKPTSGRSNRSRSRSPGSSKKYATSSSSASTKRRHSRSRTRSPSRGRTHKSRSRSPNRHKSTSAQKPPQNSTDQKEKKSTEKRPPVPSAPTSDSKKPESDETSKKKKKHSQNDEANSNKQTTTTTSTLDDSEKKSADKSSKHKSKKKHKHKHHRSSRSPSNH